MNEVIDAACDAEEFEDKWEGGLRDRTLTPIVLSFIQDTENEDVRAALRTIALMGWLEGTRNLRRKQQ